MQYKISLNIICFEEYLDCIFIYLFYKMHASEACGEIKTFSSTREQFASNFEMEQKKGVLCMIVPQKRSP